MLPGIAYLKSHAKLEDLVVVKGACCTIEGIGGYEKGLGWKGRREWCVVK